MTGVRRQWPLVGKRNTCHIYYLHSTHWNADVGYYASAVGTIASIVLEIKWFLSLPGPVPTVLQCSRPGDIEWNW